MKKLLLLISMTVACLTTAQAAISVGAGGSGVINFNTVAEIPASEFATGVLTGSGTTYSTAAGVQAGVNTITAANIVRVLPQTATVPPSAFSGGFRQNTNAAAFYLQSRPTTDATNAASVLMATLQNTSGGNIASITVSYAFSVTSVNAVDEIPGFQVMYSLTGAPGSWQPIAALSDNTTVGTQNAVVPVGTWADGATIYLIWADDNSSTGGTDSGYTIDDFSVAIGGVINNSVTITSPTNGAAFSQGSLITINASAVMANAVTNIAFFQNGNLIGNDGTSPFSVVYSNATLGAHTLTATATDNTGATVNSTATVQITVNANVPPSVTVTNPGTQSYLVGANVINNAVASDSDGSIARVEFYLDGVFRYTDTTASYNYQYDDSIVGSHTVLAVAVDNTGARGSNTVSFTITNPPNVTLLLTNGSTWKYLDNTNDPSLAGAWTTLGFNDSSWSNGVAELGFGDTQDGRPEVTQLRQILTNTLDNTTYTNITFYFRKVITVGDPTAFGALTLNVKEDDGSIVYINGVEVYRATNMPAGPVGHSTFALSTKPDDGSAYYSSTLLSSVLVSGQNIIAVEVHQNSITSSDTSFDLMLWGQVAAGPTLKITRLNATQADISWPLSADPSALYFKTDLNAASWTIEPSADVPSGGFHHVTVNTTSGNKFWTLRKP